MSNHSTTLNKLIILYTLNKVEVPLPSNIISDFVTTREYANYFAIQDAFAELLETKLINEEHTYHGSYYQITEIGQQTLNAFCSQLSRETQTEIDEYLKEKKYQIIDETSYVCDYRATADHTYLASCTLREGNHTIFHIDLEIATEDEAIKVCDNWQVNSQVIYQTALLNLLK